METVTIEHKEHGRVEGVRWVEGTYWLKAGAHYFSSKGWKEAKPKKWVEYATQELKNKDECWRCLSVWFGGDTTPTIFEVPEGFRWKTVEIEREVE